MSALRRTPTPSSHYSHIINTRLSISKGRDHRVSSQANTNTKQSLLAHYKYKIVYIKRQGPSCQLSGEHQHQAVITRTAAAEYAPRAGRTSHKAYRLLPASPSCSYRSRFYENLCKHYLTKAHGLIFKEGTLPGLARQLISNSAPNCN